jgi:hypothetical protein
MWCSGCSVYVACSHAHKDLGSFTGKWSGEVEGHDIAFLVVTAA